jgi:hypothetical protein
VRLEANLRLAAWETKGIPANAGVPFSLTKVIIKTSVQTVGDEEIPGKLAFAALHRIHIIKVCTLDPTVE